MKAMVVVPTYNEAENIDVLSRKIIGLNGDIHILIVDDSSPDGTGAIADSLAQEFSRIHVLHREGKLGLGSAYIAGFKYAIQEKYDYVLQMDADFSHDPNYIPTFIEMMKEYDYVLGSRYVDGISVINWKFSRVVVSFLANKYVRFVTGMHFSDCMGGYKCFRRQVLEALDLDRFISSGYALQMEILYRTYKKGFKIGEIPIIFYPRNIGLSKMSKMEIIKTLFVVILVRLLART